MLEMVSDEDVLVHCKTWRVGAIGHFFRFNIVDDGNFMLG